MPGWEEAGKREDRDGAVEPPLILGYWDYTGQLYT